MTASKTAILQVIYTCFSEWASKEKWACKRGCSTCCTQNVMVTSLEARLILDHLRENKRVNLVSSALSKKLTPQRPTTTHNEFASACIKGEQLEEPKATFSSCPFLEQNECSIYPVRPFSCRCFLSLHRCSPNRSAVVSDSYIAASMAINQLIEHLGQGDLWGNMLDMLSYLLTTPPYGGNRGENGSKESALYRDYLLIAQPLPGFMLSEEDYTKVSSLLESIFQSRVEDKSVEDVLNGR